MLVCWEDVDWLVFEAVAMPCRYCKAVVESPYVRRSSQMMVRSGDREACIRQGIHTTLIHAFCRGVAFFMSLQCCGNKPNAQRRHVCTQIVSISRTVQAAVATERSVSWVMTWNSVSRSAASFVSTSKQTTQPWSGSVTSSTAMPHQYTGPPDT
jgi:hypothetical protein